MRCRFPEVLLLAVATLATGCAPKTIARAAVITTPPEAATTITRLETVAGSPVLLADTADPDDSGYQRAVWRKGAWRDWTRLPDFLREDAFGSPGDPFIYDLPNYGAWRSSPDLGATWQSHPRPPARSTPADDWGPLSFDFSVARARWADHEIRLLRSTQPDDEGLWTATRNVLTDVRTAPQPVPVLRAPQQGPFPARRLAMTRLRERITVAQIEKQPDSTVVTFLRGMLATDGSVAWSTTPATIRLPALVYPSLAAHQDDAGNGLALLDSKGPAVLVTFARDGQVLSKVLEKETGIYAESPVLIRTPGGRWALAWIDARNSKRRGISVPWAPNRTDHDEVFVATLDTNGRVEVQRVSDPAYAAQSLRLAPTRDGLLVAWTEHALREDRHETGSRGPALHIGTWELPDARRR